MIVENERHNITVDVRIKKKKKILGICDIAKESVLP